MPATVRPLSPADRHCCFGYYDRSPWDAGHRRHLALTIPQQEHLPGPDETAVVGYIDHSEGDRKIDIAETRAWNHQQGAMTHWLPEEPGHIVFNDRDGDRVFSRVIDMSGREVRRLPRPVYGLDPRGRRTVTVDFARFQRRGYSYAVANTRETGAPGIPTADGLWVMDVRDGTTQLIASTAQCAALIGEPDDLPEAWVWLDHPAFNRDGSRIMFLFRYLLPKGGWKTWLFTIGVEGEDLRLVLPHAWWKSGGVTHQEWGRTPNEILVDGHFRERGGGEFTVLRDAPGHPRLQVLAPGIFFHGHQMFSPDGGRLVTDTYPQEGIQSLAVVDVASGACEVVARMEHCVPGVTGDLRCDLHPRWRPDGRALSIDSIHDGRRRIWLVELT